MTEFKLKKAICAPDKLQESIKKLEESWLDALLQRAGVNKILLDKRKKSEIGNSQWRDLLLRDFQLTIVKNIATGKMKVEQLKDDKLIAIAEWHKPTITYVTAKDNIHYRIDLKYWSLI